MAEAYAPMLDRAAAARICGAARARARRPRPSAAGGPAIRDRLMPGHVHIIGAGLAGLSAAVRLTQAGIAVTVHEATRQAGGRCRSYDDAATGMHIDNGTHLLLSGNHSAVDYLKAIGDRAGISRRRIFALSMARPAKAGCCGLETSESPWWIFRSIEPRAGTSIARLSQAHAAADSVAPTGRCARYSIATANSIAGCSIR